MKRLGVGMIGAGGSATTIHLPGYAVNPDVEIVGITSLDREASKNHAVKYGIRHVFDSVDDLLSEPSIEAVSISTPPSTHEPLATQAVKAGKHVLIEKPVAISIESLDRIRDLAIGSARVVELVHNERFMDFSNKAKDLIKSGRLGKIQAVHQFIGTTGPEAWAPNSAWFRSRSASGGGVLMDLAVHKIDLAGWLLDRRLLPGATAQFDGDVEDLASIYFMAADSVLLSVTASWRGPSDEGTLLVIGTDGTLEGCWTIGQLRLRRGTEILTVETEIPWTDQDQSPARMIAAFVAACREGRKIVDSDLMWDAGTRSVLEAYESRARSPRAT